MVKTKRVSDRLQLTNPRISPLTVKYEWMPLTFPAKHYFSSRKQQSKSEVLFCPPFSRLFLKVFCHRMFSLWHLSPPVQEFLLSFLCTQSFISVQSVHQLPWALIHSVMMNLSNFQVMCFYSRISMTENMIICMQWRQITLFMLAGLALTSEVITSSINDCFNIWYLWGQQECSSGCRWVPTRVPNLLKVPEAISIYLVQFWGAREFTMSCCL